MEEINKNLPCKNEEAIVTEVAPDKMLVWHEFRKNPCDEMRNQFVCYECGKLCAAVGQLYVHAFHHQWLTPVESAILDY